MENQNIQDERVKAYLNSLVNMLFRVYENGASVEEIESAIKKAIEEIDSTKESGKQLIRKFPFAI